MCGGGRAPAWSNEQTTRQRSQSSVCGCNMPQHDYVPCTRLPCAMNKQQRNNIAGITGHRYLALCLTTPLRSLGVVGVPRRIASLRTRSQTLQTLKDPTSSSAICDVFTTPAHLSATNSQVSIVHVTHDEYDTFQAVLRTHTSVIPTDRGYAKPAQHALITWHTRGNTASTPTRRAPTTRHSVGGCLPPQS